MPDTKISGLPLVTVAAGDLAPVKRADGTNAAVDLSALGGGAPGASAYQVAVANGFAGNEAAWLASLEGEPGGPGASAYAVAVAAGFVGTEAAWLASLQGADGASAYEIWLAAGNPGTEADFLASLEGEPGADGAIATDAPSDDKTYGRKNGAWAEVVASAGGGSGGSAGTRIKAAGVITVTGTTPATTTGLNIASVARTAVGRYRVTFTTPLDSINYGVNASCRFGQFDDNWTAVTGIDRHIGYGFATTHIDLLFTTANGASASDAVLYDPVAFSVEIFDAAQQAGGGSGPAHVVLTQAAYDALAPKDAATFYFITE